ncbi:MAG: stage V sporulation protein AD [Acutalibacteraceae bacterium]|jgi:stage V sporulation protein AD
MAEITGNRTIVFHNKPHIISYGSIVGKKEHEGPMREEFDSYITDSFYGEDSFEKAESKLQKTAVQIALDKAKLQNSDIDYIFAGDLLNQCIGSSFGNKERGIPFLGLYGACSTMTLSIGIASVFLDSGAANRVVAVTSSHFCSAERQYRFPLNYGSQRPQTAQWTVTGAGAVILQREGDGPYINAAVFGEIKDFGISDANNMGAAMAPAAADTIAHYLRDTNTKPDDYDLIVTGDLGYVGSQCLYELLERDGIDIRNKHNDCGVLIFDHEKQDTHAGGSGCGCSASILCSYIMHKFEKNQLKNILFMSTGALLSPTSSYQGENVPGIAHLIHIKKD